MESPVIFTAAAAGTYVLLFPARLLLRRAGIVDRPNARSSHAVPTIRGGGVAVVTTVAGGLAWLTWKVDPIRISLLLASFAMLAFVSFVDDVRSVRASLRFGVQVIAAVMSIAAIFSGNIDFSAVWVILTAVSLLWIAGYTNAFNFMDGINGIAGMQALCTGIGTAAIAIALGVESSHAIVLLALVVAGAALGFLPHNFPRPRVFMGDVGSAALGFILAALAVWIARLTSWWVLFWVGFLHANFVLDTAITLMRRKLRGDRLHDAHREHFYQRLVRAGWSHGSVTLTEAGLQVLVALALWRATNAPWQIKVAVGSAVVAAWLVFFGFAERTFRKSPAGIADAEMLAARRGVH